MSIPDPKPVKTSKLNPKLLTIAAVLLIVLALLFMATPLLRTSRGFQRSSNFVPQGNGQSFQQNGFPAQGNGQSFPQNGFPNQGSGSQSQGGSNYPNRQFAARGGGLLRLAFLNGVTGVIVYFLALLISLAAAVGMFLTRRWGQILGICMAVLYLLLGLVSLLPILLIGAIDLRNPLSLILGSAHILLAVAVIAFASIPAKKLATPAVELPPPAAIT
jgi:hypothetical protein